MKNGGKMTAKRFRYILFDGFEDYGEYISPNEVVNLLNALHEENKELKKENAQFDILIKNNQLAYIDLEKENEQLKQSQTSMLRELLIYRRIANCSNCKHQNYDWFEDGDEFEICEKGNSNQQIEYHICKEWEKF